MSNGSAKLVLLITIFIILAGVVVFFFLNPKLSVSRQVQEPQQSDNAPSKSTEIDPYVPVAAVSKARDTARKADLNALVFAVRSFQAEKGMLPSSLQQLVPVYIAEIPTDPKTQEMYVYNAEGKSFKVCGNFETEEPSEKCMTN